MPDEIPVTYKVCQDVLFQGRNGAGVEGDLFCKKRGEGLRDYHICGPHK